MYKKLLETALVEGKVSDRTKLHLEQFRADHSLSDKDHTDVLQELGWSIKEYSSGIHNNLKVAEGAVASAAAGEGVGEESVVVKESNNVNDRKCNDNSSLQKSRTLLGWIFGI